MCVSLQHQQKTYKRTKKDTYIITLQKQINIHQISYLVHSTKIHCNSTKIKGKLEQNEKVIIQILTAKLILSTIY